MKARDGASGVHSVEAEFRAMSYAPATALKRVRGDAHDGTWRGSIPVRAYTVPGRYRLTVSVTDRFGRSRVYTPHGLDFPPSRPVPLPRVIVDKWRDDDDPVLDSFTVSETSVDARTSTTTIVLEVRAHDLGSGLRPPRLSADSAHRTVTMVPTLVSGTRRDGTWRSQWRVGPCTAIGGDLVVAVDVEDLAGNTLSNPSPTRALTILAADNDPPSAVSRFSSRTAVRADFDEPVVGLTTESVVLLSWGSDWKRSVPHELSIDRLECVGPTGSAADCDAGPVGALTIIPEVPLEGGYYSMELNPEHVLSVTDLAGNPASGFPPTALPQVIE